jgi:hypothetical protein
MLQDLPVQTWFSPICCDNPIFPVTPGPISRGTAPNLKVTAAEGY